MNRLDRHVGLVRSKLTLERFFLSLGYAVAIFFGVVLIGVLVDRFLWVDLPRKMVWFWSGVGAAVLAAGGYAIVRRPSPHQAAILIDSKLGLNEKFSTALYARAQGNESDPFVIAAVLDAERTADNVSLHRRFPMAFPVSAFFAIGAAIVVLLIAWFLPRIDLFDHHAKLAAAQKQAANRIAAEHAAQSVLTAVNSLPAAVQNQAKVELAKKDLQRVLDQPNADPTVTKLTAMKAQEEADAAKQEEMKTNQAFSQAMADKAVFNSMNPSADDHGPVADASKEIANGDFSKAIDSLQQLQQKFDQMTPQEQKTATDQMKNVAQQLQKIASDPAALQNLQKQLQQQGISPQQIQQMAKAMQQSAQGNPAAQQQLQQMQKQLTQQMNGGKGPTPQQQAQIQKAMQQMQSVANSQAKAQQMTKAAQQMTHGMQQAQASKQGGTKPGQQQANAKTGNTQQPGPMQGGQNPSGQQGGNQQAAGQQPGGQQPGGQGQGGQEMQQAGQQMAQALGEMDAVQKDAEQVAAGQNANDQPDGGNNPGNNPGGPQPGPGGQGPGQFGKVGNKKGNGMGGPGIGNGGVGQKQLAQFSVKQEIDPSQNIADGKVLAKTFVKADQVIGKSTIELSPAAKSAVKESTDDVSEDTVPKDAQKAVKDYFDTVQNGN